MKTYKCLGCLQDETYCSVIQCIQKNLLKNECPCQKCIIKIKCNDYCEDFRSYCGELYETEKDLTLLLMSQKSISMFGRKSTDRNKQKDQGL